MKQNAAFVMLALSVGGFATLAGVDGAAAEQALLLEATVNGRATGELLLLYPEGRELFITAEDLQRAGIRVGAKPQERIRLGSIANRFSVDQALQTIEIEVPLDRLGTTSLRFDGFHRPDLPLAPALNSAVLNYDLMVSSAPGGAVLSGLVDARIATGAGVLSHSALGYAGATDARPVRLESQFTFSDPATLRRLRLGDVIAGGLAWTRPVRLGGLQVTTDFGLRPDLVTFPTPAFFGEATVPSTVDLFINGVRQLTQPVPPGAFEIRQVPVPTGSGSIALSVTDALGRQTSQILPFYITDRLLKEGLSAYSVEAGFVRRNYGRRSNDYGAPAVIGTVRTALGERITAEGHAEVARGVVQAGMGAVVQVGQLGIAAVSAAASTSNDGSGHQASIGIERSGDGIGLTLSRQLASPGYRDVGARAGSPVTRMATNLNLGLDLGSFGALNLAYSAYRLPATGATGAAGAAVGAGSALGNDAGTAQITGGPALSSVASSVRVLSVAYFKSFRNNITLALNAFKTFSVAGSGISATLLFPFDGRKSASLGASRYAGVQTVTASATRPANLPGDIGWQVQATSGDYTQQLAELEYKGSRARLSAAAASDGHHASARAGLRGALVVAGDHVYTSNWIDDSFAIVDTGSVGAVSVFLENRPVGKTADNGTLLVPSLRSYDVNRISINLSELPINARIEYPEQFVKPRDRSASLVDFRITQGRAARVLLIDVSGVPLPVGGSVTIVATGESAPLGYNGETFSPDLAPGATLRALLPSGTSCSAIASYALVAGTIAIVGPISCQ